MPSDFFTASTVTARARSIASGSIGGQYSYNIVGAVASELHKPPFLVNNTSIGLLFAAYSFPNTVMPLLGGFINDRLGVRVSSQVRQP